MSLLLVLSGLPGVGKTTIARHVARALQAAHLRIDTIEQALRTCGTLADGVGVEGYAVAYAVAADQLAVGRPVVADAVNGIGVAREAWRAVASRANARLVEVEIVCSDPAEHRRRVESRTADIPGHVHPTWAAVQARRFEPWDRPTIRLDSAGRDADACAQALLDRIAAPNTDRPPVQGPT